MFDQAGIRITFPKPENNSIRQFVFNQGGQTLVAPRLKDVDLKTIDLNSYVGTYYSPELETSYSITLKENRLTANHIRHDPADLTMTEKDLFSTDAWFMSKIEFLRNNDQKISGLKVSSGRVKNVRFLKQP